MNIKRIYSKQVAAFPHILRGSANDSFEKASRFCEARASFTSEEPRISFRNGTDTRRVIGKRKQIDTEERPRPAWKGNVTMDGSLAQGSAR